MSGKITVTKTRDWLTPFEVEVAIDGRPPSTSQFTVPAKAQKYVWEMADLHELDVIYNVDTEPGEPRRITPEEFAARIPKICAKCRRSKPLAEFRVLTRVNATTGRAGHHGWAERCLSCEETHGA